MRASSGRPRDPAGNRGRICPRGRPGQGSLRPASAVQGPAAARAPGNWQRMPGSPPGVLPSRRGCGMRASSKPEPAAGAESLRSPGAGEAGGGAVGLRQGRRRRGRCGRSGGCWAALGDWASSRRLAPAAARGCELLTRLQRRCGPSPGGACTTSRQRGLAGGWLSLVVREVGSYFGFFKTFRFSFSLVIVSSLLKQMQQLNKNTIAHSPDEAVDCTLVYN